MGPRLNHARAVYCLCVVALAVVVGLGAVSIRRSAGSWTEKTTGRFKVMMGRTPPPSRPVKEASLCVTRIEVLRTRQAAEPASLAAAIPGVVQPAEPIEDSWIVVYEGEQILNLLELRNGHGSLLINADVPAGHYMRLRLHCRQARLSIGDPQSGIADRSFVWGPRDRPVSVTLPCDFTVAAGRETTLLLNFDVDRAFLPVRAEGFSNIGEIRDVEFRPQAAMRLTSLTSSGRPAQTYREE